MIVCRLLALCPLVSSCHLTAAPWTRVSTSALGTAAWRWGRSWFTRWRSPSSPLTPPSRSRASGCSRTTPERTSSASQSRWKLSLESVWNIKFVLCSPCSKLESKCSQFVIDGCVFLSIHRKNVDYQQWMIYRITCLGRQETSRKSQANPEESLHLDKV